MTIEAPKASADNVPKAIILVIFAMISFATQDAIIKILAADYPAVQVAWVRFVILPFIAVAYAWHRGALPNAFKSARPRLQIVRCSMIILDILTFVVALKFLPLADMHALVATSPLIIIALSALFLREKVGTRRWAAVAVGFIGVLIIVRPGITVFQPGSALGLAAAFLFSAYIVLTRAVSRYDSTETSFLYFAFFGLVVTTVFGPFFWVKPTPEAWFWLIVLSLVSAFSHLLLMMALELAPASILQPFNYLLLPLAAVFGLLIFNEFPDKWVIVGAVIIVASGLYAYFRERKLARDTKSNQPDAA
ncbi:MAG: DMT family transporter [Pseudomonadota bacterium]